MVHPEFKPYNFTIVYKCNECDYTTEILEHIDHHMKTIDKEYMERIPENMTVIDMCCKMVRYEVEMFNREYSTNDSLIILHKIWKLVLKEHGK